MVELANRFPNAEGVLQRALNQAARELVLMQSSDWAFLMTVGTAKQYSTKRTKEHVKRFIAVYEMIIANRIDESYIWDLEQKDNIFPNIDYNVYASKETAEILAN
jgi:1,4-alpha-glucan branching enzyme